mmetsp:Transcript_97774/g.224181  ORF Transcript_97774/g.224181 Transcript_97774/m.224181 type:complete len:208 (-) Transcript_97774:41-664(-)
MARPPRTSARGLVSRGAAAHTLGLVDRGGDRSRGEVGLDDRRISDAATRSGRLSLPRVNPPPRRRHCTEAPDCKNAATFGSTGWEKSAVKSCCLQRLPRKNKITNAVQLLRNLPLTIPCRSTNSNGTPTSDNTASIASQFPPTSTSVCGAQVARPRMLRCCLGHTVSKIRSSTTPSRRSSKRLTTRPAMLPAHPSSSRFPTLRCPLP